MKTVFRVLPVVALLLGGAAMPTVQAMASNTAVSFRYPFVRNPYATGYTEGQNWASGRSQADIDYELNIANRLRDEINPNEVNSLNQYYYLSGYIDGLSGF
ncbi:hypothetical protein MUN82_07200 [Hymenobacter aerilatus]|uniref:Uncharacterized protein n=1 Tax=Hymenobacter aerilatus TaxID=2932251 RepID=A0A8T9T4Q3_9BACT|nr:hypothetical protein [Hymenobacter aerilatus]UOR06879.1 hypothetical protein MUN82_07200 [Hymenobacter aerilatus]